MTRFKGPCKQQKRSCAVGKQWLSQKNQLFFQNTLFQLGHTPLAELCLHCLNFKPKLIAFLILTFGRGYKEGERIDEWIKSSFEVCFSLSIGRARFVKHPGSCSCQLLWVQDARADYPCKWLRQDCNRVNTVGKDEWFLWKPTLFITKSRECPKRNQ